MRKPAVWLLEAVEKASMSSLSTGPGGQNAGRGRCLQESLVFLGLERGLLCMTHMVHIQSEDKGWKLQMDLVPAETSLLKDSDGKMPLIHRKLFF